MLPVDWQMTALKGWASQAGQIGNGRNPPDLRFAEIILTGAYRQYSGFTNAAPMPVTARRPCGLGTLLIRLFLSGLV
jgi:hypothetical protein